MAHGEAPASRIDLGLGGTVGDAVCSKLTQATREIDLGHWDGRSGGGDDVRLREADDHGGATPASAPERYTARGLQSSTPASSSPCDGASGWLHDDRRAAARQNDDGGELWGWCGSSATRVSRGKDGRSGGGAP
jgi:hypothetical protein